MTPEILQGRFWLEQFCYRKSKSDDFELLAPISDHTDEVPTAPLYFEHLDPPCNNAAALDARQAALHVVGLCVPESEYCAQVSGSLTRYTSRRRRLLTSSRTISGASLLDEALLRRKLHSCRKSGRLIYCLASDAHLTKPAGSASCLANRISSTAAPPSHVVKLPAVNDRTLLSSEIRTRCCSICPAIEGRKMINLQKACLGPHKP